MNLYAYVKNSPAMMHDPDGCQGMSTREDPRSYLTWQAYADANAERFTSSAEARPMWEAAQRSQPSGDAPIGPPPPPAPPAGANSGLVNTVGAVQIAGGGFEMYSGGAALATGIALLLVPEPSVTKVAALVILGGLLVAHGADTTAAGVRTLESGQVQHTYTYQASYSATGSRAFATTVDIAAGVGPSVGIGLTRRALVAGAENGPALALGYLHRGTSAVGDTGVMAGVPIGGGQAAGVPLGHNVVGIITEEGTQQWYHLVRGEGGEALMVPYADATATSLADKGGYLITFLPATAGGTAKALSAATVTVPSAVAGQSWQLVGPNCTTAAATVLGAGGTSVPFWAQSPLLLHTAIRYPLAGTATLGAVGGGAAASAPAAAQPK